MHNNYYFLRQLSSELEDVLKSSVISECFSQNKDELIIRFEIGAKPFFIKASLTADFCCLSFPKTFTRARKNSVNLFDAIIGQQVLGVRQFKNERSFSLKLSNQYELLFKMHGNRSNLVLFHQGKADVLFRNHLVKDLSVDLETLDKEIDWSQSAFNANLEKLNSHYFTFGKVVWDYLEVDGFSKKSPTQKWQAIEGLLYQFENPSYYISETRNHIQLTLLIENLYKLSVNSVN